MKKIGKILSLVTSHPNIYFLSQIEKHDIVWGSQEEKVPVAKTVKNSAYVNIWGAMSASGLSNLHNHASRTNCNGSILCGHNP